MKKIINRTYYQNKKYYIYLWEQTVSHFCENKYNYRVKNNHDYNRYPKKRN